MKPYYQDGLVTIYHADCRDLTFEGISAIVTDPPYGLEFMGKEWDTFRAKKQAKSQVVSWLGVGMRHRTHQENPEFYEFCFQWASHLRKMCLPGSPLLSFGGTRTFHRIACAIEDAGWEIRDTLMWVYSSGFPKSLDISKAIDKQNGQSISWFIDYVIALCDERGIPRKALTSLFPSRTGGMTGWLYNKASHNQNLTVEQYNRIKDFLGLPFETLAEAEREIVGTGKAGLTKGRIAKFAGKVEYDITKPATPEAKLWEGYGTALKPAWEPVILAMNPLDGTFAENALRHKVAGLNIDECRIPTSDNLNGGAYAVNPTKNMTNRRTVTLPPAHKTFIPPPGRYPSNLIHDGSDEVLKLFPSRGYIDNGSAARFFYIAKATFEEREAGLRGFLPCVECGGIDTKTHLDDRGNKVKCRRNNHPTVKPLALMEYLCKLVKMPEYNLILDPFCGSGTTLLACRKLRIECIGIDLDEQTCEIAAKRCSQAKIMKLL